MLFITGHRNKSSMPSCEIMKKGRHVYVLVLSVSRLLHLNPEVTTTVEYVIETFIAIMVVSNIQLVLDVLSQCESICC
jgi:hypothetical protein